MKKKILAFTIVLLALFRWETQAQIIEESQVKIRSLDHQSTVCLNMGLSLVGGLINVSGGVGENVSSYSIPAFQLTYDHMLEEWFSLGAGVSFQRMGIKYNDYTYFDEEGVLKMEDFTTKISRFNFGIRPLFHYGNFSKIDMYSGLRLGVTNWTITSNSRNPLYNPENDVNFKSGLVFAPQLILFGLRGYFTENIGANFEVAVGAPHFLSFGLSYRM